VCLISAKRSSKLFVGKSGLFSLAKGKLERCHKGHGPVDLMLFMPTDLSGQRFIACN
jgi:hypothetical protein